MSRRQGALSPLGAPLNESVMPSWLDNYQCAMASGRNGVLETCRDDIHLTGQHGDDHSGNFEINATV